MRVWQEKANFKELILKDDEIMKYLNAHEVDEIFDLNKSRKNVDVIFERLGL
jgi:adenylosuccinate lyase